ncbi:MAG: TetR family transcriptional regulator [Streptosporangiales bacterium]|nr:TetR family transcriptional regulator [Streptosporangiales bacterium]
MPRLVDHEQRRAEIGAAAVRVILRRGLDGVTIRGIAAETGWSTGSLRHYFPDQDALRGHAAAVVTRTLRERVHPRLSRPRDADSVVDGVAAIVEEFLPLDDVRREEYALWSAVVAWERGHLLEGGSTIWKDQRALYRQCVAVLLGHEPVHGIIPEAFRPHDDPAVETGAALLHTFVDGLASQILNTPGEVTPAHSADLLREFLHVLTTPTSRGS